MSKVELPITAITGISISSSSSDVTKLPTVATGRSSLVASPSLPKAHGYTHKEIAGNWALELRTRINESIECHEDVNEDDIMTLKKELIAIFIITLQADSRKEWSVFVEILALLEPYKEFFDYFETKAEFHHYLERVLYHVELHKEKLFDLHIEANLIRVFPEHVRQLKAKGLAPAKNYCIVPPLTQGLGTPSRMIAMRQQDTVPSKSHLNPRTLLPDGTNPYSSYIPTDKEIVGAKGLTIRDISKSMGAVALEMAARESIWNHTLGTTALALATDLPEEEKDTTQDEPSSVRKSLHVLQLSSRKEKTPRPVPNMQEEVLVMNGREAVQYFTSCYHMGQIKSLYLNLATNKHYRPYDLISVPKSKANPEHYVFSTFGVLHVYPDQASESLTLAEWQREAVLWNAISNIPFFKNYLIRKALHRWKTNHQFTEFQRKQRQVLSNLLSAMPPFGAALLQISHLLKELLTVPFLPTEIDKTYELGELENSINYKNIQADQLLGRFFKYCKMVVDFTSDEAFKKLRHCEVQLKKKTYFSKDSLSLQRMKKEEREKNLANAKQETSFLGNFVKLVDQLIVEHMFEITKSQTIFFVNKVLSVGLDAPREGFFKANLVFDKEGELTISPSKERFVKALESILSNISSVLTSRAITLDWWNQDRESLDGNTTTRSDNFKLSKLSQTKSHTEYKSGQASHDSTSQHHSLDSRSVDSEINTARSTFQQDTAPSERSLSLPNLTQQALPSKEMDELGVATPDLVIMHTEDEALMVEGEGFVGQYEPLSQANLKEKLLADQEYQAALNKQGELLQSALSDIDLYCQSNKWLVEIQKYCLLWNNESSQEYKAAAGFVIEQKLTELRMWSDRVRNFDRNYITENGMFYLDCSAIHDGLLPRLNDICQELVTFVADQANVLAQDLVEEMTMILKNMSDKKTDVLSFASLAKNFTNYKKNTVQYQQRVEYIKSLYEVIRMSYRQLTPEEEKWEEKIWSCWEAFLMQMQDTSEFVSTQTPLMLSQLEATFQGLRKEAIIQADLATSGQFLDPSQNPVRILAEMKGIREKFFSTQGKLQEVSICKEAISGEPFNLKFLYEMSTKMDVRQELWKYVEVTTNTIKSWKQMLFRKINIKKALEKISVWETAASRLASQLPPGDQVLAAWVSQIEEFRKHLPVLSKLAHDSLQERHWHSIFLGLNVPYDPSHPLTVEELILYNLADHSDLIHTIYMGALAENNVDQRLQNIISFWQERQFQLAKYIPDSMFTKEQTKRITSGNVRTSKLERYRQERAAAQAGVQRGLDIANDDFYILIEVDELKYNLEDSRITVDSMMASPHGGDMKDQVEYWCQALRDIDEITDLWLECQKKWQYLLKIFEQPELYNNLSQQAFKFEAVHNKFKDWMRVSSNDSKCMSIVNRRRGDRGYRLLQGDNLRTLLQSLIKEQEEILKDIDIFIEKARTGFHRLYFLSNDEVVDILSVSRNPQALLPYVRKCFPNVNSMTFALPAAVGGLQTQLDVSLNSDKLEVISIQGSHGEELPLYTKVEPVASAPKWLYNLSQVLKNTLTIALKACVQARIEEGTRQPLLVLEELAKLAKGSPMPKQEEINKEIKSTFCHWLLRFPTQSVITAEAIIWERGMTKALDRQDKEELRNLKLMLCSKLEQLVDVLQESQTYPGIAEYDRQRLEILISGLLIQGIYQKDIMKGLLDSNQITDSAFDWLKILKFRMDIRNVLRAKTVVTEIPPDTTNTRSPRRNPTTRRKRDKGPEAPKLTRTQTTVSNDYQFSTCYVQQLGHVFTYDYEYLGPCAHLVVTPLTERAFLTMGHALKTFQCGTLIGPNGSGKTEIIRELAKLLGRCMFTISCSEIITLPVMLQYMMGMVQSGCWALFDDTDRLTIGLMSVTGQQLDYLKTALRTLDLTSENQYQIRGHSHFDKKAGMGDKMIRRNSLTTLHPLPKPDEQMTPAMERQRTVPHGFNEKGLVTYFEDTWVAERDQRRHSIEREIKIKESDLYKTNKPPPLFYEHVKANRRRSQLDFSKLTSEPSYMHRMLGNVMFNGKLLQASSNFGCFMTLDASNPASLEIPYNFRLLMRPCALIVPDLEHIVSVYLQSYGFREYDSLARKMVLLFKHLGTQLWRHQQQRINLRQMKQVLHLGSAKRMDAVYQEKIVNKEKAECTSRKKDQCSVAKTEEDCLVFAIRELLTPGTERDAELTMFLDILRQIFPISTSQHVNNNSSLFDQKVKSAVLEIFKEDHMESNDMFCNKILELYTSLETSNTVILSGQPGSGKTKAHHTLARALNMLNYKMNSTTQNKDEPDSQNYLRANYKSNFKAFTGKDGQDFAKYPKIDVVHLFPGAMTSDQLLGSFEDGVWQCGLLEKVLRDSYTMCQATIAFIQNMTGQEKKNAKYQAELPSILKRWLVMDGHLDPCWTDGLKTMLDNEKRLSLGSGEGVLLKDLTNIIFETTYLRSASPSMVARCTVIHLGPGTTHWSSLYFNWKQTATRKWLLTAEGLKMLDEITQDVFPPTIKFLTQTCQTALLTDVGGEATAANSVTPGVTETSAFISIFSALLDRVMNREEIEKKVRREGLQTSVKEDNSPQSRNMGSRLTNTSQIEAVLPNYQENLKNMFAFAYIWAFGGHLHDRYKDSFSKFAHDALYRASHSVQMPISGHVYDYYIDEKTSCFAKWSERQQQDRIKNLAGFYVTPEVDRYAYLLELVMSANQPVLLAGAPGVGKSSLVRSMVLSKTSSTMVNMSKGFSSSVLQDLILAHVQAVQNKNITRAGGAAGNQDQPRHLFFLDDLSMAPNIGRYQPPLELLRSILTTGGMHDKQRKQFQRTKEAAFIAATTLPSAPGTGLGLACQVMTSRLTRHFVNLTVFTPSEDALVTLFSRPLQTWLEEFPTYSVEHHTEFARAMCQALLELHQSVKDKLRPSPSQAHYIFSLHDINKVVQGMQLMSPRTHIKKGKTKKKGEKVHNRASDSESSAPMMKVIAQLWCHEVTRNFGDRILHSEDQLWFTQKVESVVLKHFCSPREDIKQEMTTIEEDNITTTAMATPAENLGQLHQIKEKIAVKDVPHAEIAGIAQPPTIQKEKGLNEDLHSHTSSRSTSSRELKENVTGGQDGSESSTNEISHEGCAENDYTDEEMGDSHQISNARGNDSEESDESGSDSSSELSTSAASEAYGSLSETSKSSAIGLNLHPQESSNNNIKKISIQSHISTASGETPGGKSQDSAAVKRGVTFKAGLIADKKHVAFCGPLLSFEEIKGSREKLTDIIFSKFYMGCHTEALGLPAEKGYTQHNEEKLSEALQSCLTKYNKGTSQRIDLVFFKEAVHHAARLSRVLAHPKGHALLLGMSYCTGRATLTRLAAYVAHCKLFEAKAQSLPAHNLNVLRKHIKLSCHHAGVTGKPTVLLVHEDLGEEGLYDVSAVMAEGTAPGLYSEAEVQDIVGHLMPGGVQTKKVEKIEQAFDRFVKRIRQNLHIIVLLNYKGNNFSTNVNGLHDKLQRHPGLLKNCFSIDIYMPWSFKSLAQVARTWLQDTKSGVVVPWNPSCSAEQLDAASNAMAYIHLSAKAAVDHQFCHQKDPLRIFTPLTFMEFVHLFKIVNAFLVKTEKAKGSKYEQALDKINEAFGSIAEFKKEVSGLMPQHTSAAGQISDLVSQVETYKQDYIRALEQCKVQEETITQLQGPLESLRQSAQTEFDKVNPIYQAAVKVLDNLDLNAVEELRSYPSPPETVKFVMKALCLLFEKPQTWEAAKSLMVDSSFFQELIFYNKDNIPKHIFTELKKFVSDPLFVPEVVAQASSAASSICAWIHAVYAYSSIQRKMRPRMRDLMDAETKFTKAQAQLGQLRVEAQHIKTNLEQYINQHKEAIKVSKAIEKQIQAVERRIVRANNLMDNMSMQHFLWRSELKKTRRHIMCAPGDALMTAACVAYHGPLDDKSRLDLMQDWLDHIKQNKVDAQAYQEREPYSITACLELLMDGGSQPASGQRNSGDTSLESGLHKATTYQSDGSSNMTSNPQVKTFKYMSAVYDSSKYYKSELKKQDTMESIVPERDMMDEDDDEDENTILPTRPNLTLQDILSDFDELSDWRMQNLPTDLHSVQNALMMRVCCHNRKHCWPLLIDPDNQAEMWVKALYKSHNIFTQKDVADFVTEEDIPIEEANFSNDKEGDLLDPPPSRGTMLTFSDVTESGLACSQGTSLRDITSRGGVSHRTSDSEELRPVTSVTNSWDSYSLHADSEVDLPDSNLLVLVADDANINSRLINAIVHGVTVLITHVERKPLDSLFRGLLLKQFYVDKEGNKIVRVGDMAFNYHPNFCLYLSTSVPLFVKGDGLYSFPLNRVSVINMAVSDEAIINHLMFETMQVEKKEFEGQRRSNENDIILHRQRLAREHEIIREKTLNLTGPLLEDKTMLDSLLVCQTNVEHNRQMLQETRYMGDHLEGKFAHYTPFIKHSAMLYNVLGKMSVLYPCYYLPFYKFVDMFAAIIKSRDRGKGSLGAPQVRAQELSDAVLHGIFRYARLMMFEKHYNLLALIVSLERMLRQRKVSNKELSLFVNGFQKLGLDDASLAEQKPGWMIVSAWIDCSILESLHHPFHGLCESLVNYSQQWREYFQHPISLLNPVPGDTLQELSFFQKCLLWKLVCPQKFAELSHAIILYELGSAVDAPDNYDIREVYTYTDKHMPTMFILPSSQQTLATDGTQGIPFVSPAQEIKRLAREMGMEGKVRILNFGVSSQMLDVYQAIEDCLQTGHWLILQNYHLAKDIDTQFFSLLKDIIYSRWMMNDNVADQHTDGRCLVDRSLHSRSKLTAAKSHDTFRLWITTKADGKRIMPGLLMQHGLRVTCEVTANFRSLLWKAYKSAAFLLNTRAVNGEQLVQRFNRVMPLALLHAIILQQSYFGRHAFVKQYFWTAADMAAAVEILQGLTRWSTDADAISGLIADFYTGHCLDLTDAHSVEAVVKDLALHATQACKFLSSECKGAAQLLFKLSTVVKETNDLQRTIDSIEDTSARTYCLPADVEELHMETSSRIFLKELVQATGAPELLLDAMSSTSTLKPEPSCIISTLLGHLAACPILPDTSIDQIMPLDAFLCQEVMGYKELLQIVANDLSLIKRAVSGEISLTTNMSAILEAICHDQVPTSWLINTFPTSPSVDLWLKELPTRMVYVNQCLAKCPPVLSLHMFLRPDRLFKVVMQTHAQKNFKDINEVILEYQVMPRDFVPSQKPDDGVFIGGLELKNASWDNTQSVLIDARSCTGVTNDLPVLWLKPNISGNMKEEEGDCKHDYICPLYSARHSELHCNSNKIWAIPLAIAEPALWWAQKRTVLTLKSDCLSFT